MTAAGSGFSVSRVTANRTHTLVSGITVISVMERVFSLTSGAGVWRRGRRQRPGIITLA